MINSSIANIQTNKSQINTMDTQLSTQKKINKPSDDPIIAIRALRLRSSLDQVTQYINKNIPDASSWLSVTHDAYFHWLSASGISLSFSPAQPLSADCGQWEQHFFQATRSWQSENPCHRNIA